MSIATNHPPSFCYWSVTESIAGWVATSELQREDCQPLERLLWASECILCSREAICDIFG